MSDEPKVLKATIFVLSDTVAVQPISRKRNPYISLADCAREFEVSVNRMREICTQGHVGHQLPCGTWVITQAEWHYFKTIGRPKAVPKPIPRARKPIG